MEDFVPYEIAKKLKEKGFVGDCEIGGYGGYYYHEGSEVYIQYDSDADNNCIGSDEYLRPTISQVLKWLREEKKLFVLPRIDDLGWCYSIHSDLYWDECGALLRSSYHAKSFFEEYEEAMLAGIEYTLDRLI